MTEHLSTDFSTIREWIESHGGYPATMRDISEGEYHAPETMRIAFDESNPDIERIEWEDFFDWFEQENLALRYDDKETGLAAFEFVDRERAQSDMEPENEALDSGDSDEMRDNLYPDSNDG